MIDVFHSFMDVNRRFNRLVFDSFYIHDLNMTTIIDTTSLYDQTSLIDPKVLSRICEKILPRIHDQIYKLTVGFMYSNGQKVDDTLIINVDKQTRGPS
ncbi:unnamed protein product, partial [Rotaria sp. Silwood2]